MQEFIDKLEERDPSLSLALVNDPDGIDTILVQFSANTGDPEASRKLQEDIEAIWPGDDEAITATSESIISFAVTDAIRDRQTESNPHDDRGRCTRALILLLVDGAPGAAGDSGGGADRARPHLGAGHDGAAGHPLHDHHVDHHGAVYRDRRGLHDPYDPSLPRRVHATARPGEGGDSDAGDDRLGAAGLRADDDARDRSAGGLAVGGVPAVRHNRGDHDRLLADRFGAGSAAGDDGLGRVPEHAPARDGTAPVGRAGRGDRGDTPPARWGVGAGWGSRSLQHWCGKPKKTSAIDSAS